MLRIVRAAATALGLVLFAAAHADPVTQGQEIAAQALKAYDSGNFSTAADLFGQALVLRPNHPGLTLRFVRACVRAGRMEDALRALGDYAAMGLKAEINHDPEWRGLTTRPQFAAIAAQFAENAKPKGNIAVVATIAEPEIIGEGLARDQATGRLFVASVHKRKVLVLNGTAATDFVASGHDGLLGAFGLAIDPAKSSLFAATSALPHMAGFAASDKGKAGIFEFALSDGRLKRRVLVAADGQEHVIGDLVIAPTGDVFASDSSSPVIYRLGRTAAALAEFVRRDTFHSLQGLALSADGKKLAVADYSAGIHVVDMATKMPKVLAMPPHTTLHGIDALLRHGRDLVAVQNGVDPQRIVILRMTQTWSAVEGLEVLAANLPELDEPTLATLDGGDLLVIGNGQWSHFADDGGIKSGAQFMPTRIVRLVLPAARQ